MIDVKGISQKLSEQVESVCKHLLPGGVRDGKEWVAGSVNGEEGKSCKVRLEGDKKGVFCDFATGETGDLLDLWVASKGLSLSESLQEAKKFLGITDPHFEGQRKKEWKRPAAPKEARKIKLESAVMQYLTGERKLLPETIAKYQIAEAEAIKGKAGPWVIFPSKSEAGGLENIKYLNLKRDDKGKKVMFTESDARPILFGWQAISLLSRTIILTEGEIDALTMYQYGYPALSLPFGGGKGEKQRWIDEEWQSLERFETIYLCFDDDEEGHIAARDISSRIGQHRCRVIVLPKKDANECLKAGIPKEEIDKAIIEAAYCDPEELKKASEFTEEVLREFSTDRYGFYLPVPWDKAKNKIKMGRGEVSVWTGINGHGKSTLLTQIIVSAIQEGEKFCIASLEMPARKTLAKMVRQVTGERQPTPAKIKDCNNGFDYKVWLFDLVGTAKSERLLEVFNYAYQRFGINQFVIDSLMKCGISEDDYREQKAFVEHLSDFVHKTGTHVHLVAHSRKPANEESPVGKLDVKGTGAITDLVDNCFSAWRNKDKEKKKESGDHYDYNTPDTLLICDKQRYGEWEGRVGLFFEPGSLRFYDNPELTGLNYNQTREVEDDFWKE